MICYEGVMVFLSLLDYLGSACSSFFSFVLFGDCFLEGLGGVQVPGVGVYDGGSLPICFIPAGRVDLSSCVLVFNPLIPSCLTF